MGTAIKETVQTLTGQTNSAGAVQYDASAYRKARTDTEGLDADRATALQSAKERRARLAARNGRQNMRVELAPSYLNGAGISVRGR